MSQHEVAEDRSANLAALNESASPEPVNVGESSSPLKEMKSERAFIGAAEIRAVGAENVELEAVDTDKIGELT